MTEGHYPHTDLELRKEFAGAHALQPWCTGHGFDASQDAIQKLKKKKIIV